MAEDPTDWRVIQRGVDAVMSHLRRAVPAEQSEPARTVQYVNRDEDSYQDRVDRGQIDAIDPAEEREWWIRHDALYDWQDQTWPPATRHPDEEVLAPFIAAQRIKHAALETVEAATEADYRASRALLEEPPAALTHQPIRALDDAYDDGYDAY